MRVRSAVALALALLPLLALSACAGGPARVLPGLAHPAASAQEGFRLQEGATLHDYNGINLVLPPDWQADTADNCLTPPEAGPSPGGECPPSALRVRPNAAGDGLIDAAGDDLDDPGKWQRPWAACPQNPGRDDPIRAESAEITDRGGFGLVSGERAEFSEWTVTCTGGAVFRTRAWFVAEVDLEFHVLVLSDQDTDGYSAIVRSVDLSRYQGG